MCMRRAEYHLEQADGHLEVATRQVDKLHGHVGNADGRKIVRAAGERLVFLVEPELHRFVRAPRPNDLAISPRCFS